MTWWLCLSISAGWKVDSTIFCFWGYSSDSLVNLDLLILLINIAIIIMVLNIINIIIIIINMNLVVLLCNFVTTRATSAKGASEVLVKKPIPGNILIIWCFDGSSMIYNSHMNIILENQFSISRENKKHTSGLMTLPMCSLMHIKAIPCIYMAFKSGHLECFHWDFVSRPEIIVDTLATGMTQPGNQLRNQCKRRHPMTTF